jgi:ERCC4-type nuclease
MNCILKIDNREIKCKEILEKTVDKESIELNNLVHGDFQVCINNEVCFIFERKTYNDLLASIKDGRYKNQKKSILESYHVTQYYYIIEGSFNYKHNTTDINLKIFQSAIINSLLRDKIGIFYTKTWNETCELIMSIYNRVKENPKEYMSHLKCKEGEENGIEIEQQIKKNNKKIKNALDYWKEQLCQVPDISLKTAEAISIKYKSCKELIELMSNKSKEEISKEIGEIKTTDANGKSRKISSKIVENICKYILLIE